MRCFLTNKVQTLIIYGWLSVGWMEGWMDGWMEGWMENCLNEWMEGWKEGISNNKTTGKYFTFMVFRCKWKPP